MPEFDLGRVVGPTGPQGPQGVRGLEGPTGPQGVPGNDGITPNIQVGKVTTLPAGSDAKVTRQAGSPDAAPVFDFELPRGASAQLDYVHTFSTGDWVSEDLELTITIPAATHEREGTLMGYRIFAKGEDGVYRANVWAAMETYAVKAENGDIVLHYGESTGYDGRALLSTY